jgi:beta-glucosidase
MSGEGQGDCGMGDNGDEAMGRGVRASGWKGMSLDLRLLPVACAAACFFATPNHAALARDARDPAQARPLPVPSHDAAWPKVTETPWDDAALEAQVRRIVAGMTLTQKVGQMTQAEIESITPDEVRQYAIGSVLNGGGSWPNHDKHASIRDWLALAEAAHGERAAGSDLNGELASVEAR